MSVVVLFGGITKVTSSYFSMLPSFPPGASSSSSIQVEGKYVHVLGDKQTRAHTSLLGSQGPWLSRAACGGLSRGCVKPTTAWRVRKPAEWRRVSRWAPAPPCAVIPTPGWVLALCRQSEECLVRSALSHRHSIYLFVYFSCTGSSLWCSGFLYLWLMWASPVALCRISCPTICGILVPWAGIEPCLWHWKADS